jgi:hypothetical protein
VRKRERAPELESERNDEGIALEESRPSESRERNNQREREKDE